MSCTEKETKKWARSSPLQPKVLAGPRGQQGNTRNATQLGFFSLLQLQLGPPQINKILTAGVSLPERNLAQDEHEKQRKSAFIEVLPHLILAASHCHLPQQQVAQFLQHFQQN